MQLIIGARNLSSLSRSASSSPNLLMLVALVTSSLWIGADRQPVGAIERAVDWRPPPESIQRPVADAVVADPFRLTAGPYGPGNRGLEFATAGGEVVVATESGRVRFAGSVGHSVHVSVRHSGSTVSTYSQLSEIAAGLAEGDVIERGGVVGRAGPGFHFGVIVDGEYVDPAPLIAGSEELRVRLVSVPGRSVTEAAPQRIESPSASAARVTAGLDRHRPIPLQWDRIGTVAP